MSGARIRLRYSGFVTLGAHIAFLVVGLVFTTMVTRKLDVKDYGLWSTMRVLASYFTVWIPSVYGYWITRDVARGKYDSARTGVNISLALGVVSMVLYTLIAMPVADRFNASHGYFILYSVCLLFSFYYSPYEAAARGTKPEHIELSNLIGTIVKLGVGYFLLIVLNLGLTGIIIAFIFYMLLRALYYRRVMHGIMSKGRVRLELVKSWLAKSWIPLIGITAFMLLQLDVMIVAMITGSSEAIAHYRVVQIYMQTISSMGLLTVGLYPFLLASAEESEVKRTLKESINLILFLAVPAVLGIMVSADYFLALLRMEYVVNANALRIAAVYAMLTICTSILDSMLTGTEKIDLNEKATLRAYAKSRLFTTAIGHMVLPAVVLPSIVLISQAFSSSLVKLVFLWYLSYIIGRIVYSFYLGALVKKSRIPIEIDLKTVASIVFSAIVSALLVYLCGQYLATSRMFLTMLFNIVALLAVGCSYFVPLYLTSSWFRRLVRDAISFLRTAKF